MLTGATKLGATSDAELLQLYKDTDALHFQLQQALKNMHTPPPPRPPMNTTVHEASPDFVGDLLGDDSPDEPPTEGSKMDKRGLKNARAEVSSYYAQGMATFLQSILAPTEMHTAAYILPSTEAKLSHATMTEPQIARVVVTDNQNVVSHTPIFEKQSSHKQGMEAFPDLLIPSGVCKLHSVHSTHSVGPMQTNTIGIKTLNATHGNDTHCRL